LKYIARRIWDIPTKEIHLQQEEGGAECRRKKGPILYEKTTKTLINEHEKDHHED
jgi:hypothetical protein